ncbi:helix-turn-helix transcriptional regulator [Microterricola viridarii]|uniref:DNA-binding response regulator, NarL/FixJ family, contains REC and HTH domains n=1 Tax=Microterricola viridarii TaxID=412690 RepID=A0A0X8E2R5_9MICO|nr:hypothetical protein [Microterricola viridarii]AMB59409.1 hypothetical protein AWU67_11665 [Microterricola viridarii]
MTATQDVPAPSSAIRLAIVHSHVAALDGLGSWLAANAPDLEIVVLASSWDEAEEQAAAQPAAYLIDLDSLGDSMLVERIADARSRGAAVVVWDGGDDDAWHTLRAAGAAAVLCPHSSIEDARAAVVAAVAQGPDSWTGDRVATAHHRAIPGNSGEHPAVRRAPAQDGEAGVALRASAFPRLSEADVEVIRLYASGSSPVDIALQLNVRFDWVRDHLGRVRDHYEGQGRRASNRRDLVQRATEDGLLEA